MRPAYEVAGVLNAHWNTVSGSGYSSWQLRTLDAIRRCRTSSLGAHVDGCTSCGHIRISYNSCRNRHCPKCQSNEREQWIKARESELLPVPYFHVVFTLPDILNQLCLHKDREMYNMLFESVWYVINKFGRDHKWLGAQTGVISILHTCLSRAKLTGGTDHDAASTSALYYTWWWINQARQMENSKERWQVSL